MIYLAAVISIALGAVGQFGLKLASGSLQTGSGIWKLGLSMLNLKMILAVACFITSMVIWIFVLRKMELSIAYPMVSLGYIFVMMLSFYFLRETMSLPKLLGTGLIILGVIVLNL
ncbi:MAG: putative 4-amino-4-deoxy-L-arabinose-phosphoundecaprenol flippase subunit ArnE [Candidatus Dichloromethanomonas elyunquensis]|nr:MAG: putative 4-amino-4-deoxy-L-arabinose-phosphoundecaprenol flippase subunit ArnE [Candidatus Dichloromethanomonas elyunquensis]